MRKEKMVTRTFKESEVNVMAIDLTDNNNLFNMVDTFNGFLNNDEALIAFRTRWETNNLKIVAVNTVEHREVLRGMTESAFLANSVILPPRTKAEEAEEAEEAEA